MKNFLRINNFASPFKMHKTSFYFNNLLTKNFCINDINDSISGNQSVNINKAVYDGVLFTEHNKSLTEITLNMPKKHNALDLKMIKYMLKKVRLWIPFNIDGFSSEGDGKAIPKVALFTGNGKAFCSGGDVKALYLAKQENVHAKLLKDFFHYEYLLDYSITKLTPIQVSLWHGNVMGGGVGLSINSPIRICTDASSFGMPEAKIGLFTDVGASYFLPRIFSNSVETGLYMALTGETIKGKDLAVTGVATHYVKQENFDKIKQLIIENVNEKTNIQSLNEFINNNTDYTHSNDKFIFPHQEAIKYVFKMDSLNNIIIRLNNILEGKKEEIKENSEIILSKDGKDWALKTKTTIENASPLSLVVIFELLKRGLQMASIDEAYDIEAQVVNGFMEDSDFFEGVRALLVDKDLKPQWRHKSISDVNVNEVIKQYFERTEEITTDPNKTDM